MVKWGNEKANFYWEYAWPKDSTPSEKNMDNFIRAKYERKQYAKSLDVPDPSTLGGAAIEFPVESKSSIPAVKVASATQSTFTAFANSTPSVSNTAATAAPASASQQLFDAFSAPASTPAQTQKSFKDSIMSMYATSPSPTKLAAASPQQSGFGDFADFQHAPAATSTGNSFAFDAFSSTATANTTTAIASAAKPPSFDPFGSLEVNVKKENPTKTSSNGGGNSTFDAFASLNLNFSGTTNPIPVTSTKPKNSSVNLLDDFEPAPAPVTTASNGFVSSAFPTSNRPLPSSSSFTDFPSAPSKPSATSASPPAAFDDFNGFSSATTNQSSSLSTANVSVVTSSFSQQQPVTSTVALPDHSRASTGFGDIVTSPSKSTPVNFDNLPPIEDGWSSFQ